MLMKSSTLDLNFPPLAFTSKDSNLGVVTRMNDLVSDMFNRILIFQRRIPESYTKRKENHWINKQNKRFSANVYFVEIKIVKKNENSYENVKLSLFIEKGLLLCFGKPFIASYSMTNQHYMLILPVYIHVYWTAKETSHQKTWFEIFNIAINRFIFRVFIIYNFLLIQSPVFRLNAL